MPKRKKGRKPVQLHQESASGDGDLPHPPQTMIQEQQTMIEEPQTLPQSPQQQQPPSSGGGSEELQDMATSSPPPPVPDGAAAVPELPPPQNPPPTTSRKAPGKRRKSLPVKKLALIEEKLTLLGQNLRPFPFSPGRYPDLPRHERLFRALGLWDFASLDLDRDLRPDLLALLIANYDPQQRRSFVLGTRIMVSRADLARALALPVKRDKAALSDSDLELFSGEEAATVVTDFVSNRMVFLEDACVLPDEVVAASRHVKEGQPHKVDWAGLMWTMVEKELLEAPTSGQCFYASHLHRLMKHQHPKLFETGAEPNVEPGPPLEVVLEEEEDDISNGGDAVRTRSLEDIQDMNLDNHDPGLSLGLGGEVDPMVGLEGCKGEEEENWLADRKDADVNHSLRRCNSKDDMILECEGTSKEEEEEGRGGRVEERFDEDLAEKFSSFEGLSSTVLLQAMETGNVSYNMPVHPLDPTSGEFLAMGSETHKNMVLDPDPASQFLFGDNCKREIDEIYNEDNGDDVHGLSEANQQKRMRSDGSWEHAPLEYYTCMEQIQCWIDKSKMTYAEKEQACTNAQMQLEYMTNLLQQKDQVIQTLEKARMEEIQRRHRIEHELKVMSQVVYGYKKALKETRSAFDEYRKQFPLGDEPLYNDVGTGGIVLSTGELERLRLEKEKEMRQVAVAMINAFQRDWFAKLNTYAELLTKLLIKLGELDEDIKLLKGRFEEIKLLKGSFAA